MPSSTSEEAGQALFEFLRSMVLQWGAADRGLVEALAGVGIDINSAAPQAEDDFLALSPNCCVPPNKRVPRGRTCR